MVIPKTLLSILLGFSFGIIIAGAIFSFIAIIGLVPRLAQKTKTQNYIKFYEEVIIVGGIWGALTLFIDFRINLPAIVVAFLSLSLGVFIGCLVVSLAEVINVVPILTRRISIDKGLKYFMLAIAIGKLIGSLMYFFIPGFQ